MPLRQEVDGLERQARHQRAPGLLLQNRARDVVVRRRAKLPLLATDVPAGATRRQRAERAAHEDVDLGNRVRREAADARQPVLADRARAHLLIGEQRPGGRVQLRQLVRDGAIVAHAAAAARAELHEQPVRQPRAHLRVDAVPVGRHVAVVARERVVVVGRAERAFARCA